MKIYHCICMYVPMYADVEYFRVSRLAALGRNAKIFDQLTRVD